MLFQYLHHLFHYYYNKFLLLYNYYNIVAVIDRTGLYSEDDIIIGTVGGASIKHGDPFKTESSSSLIQGLYASDTSIQIVKVVKIMGV